MLLMMNISEISVALPLLAWSSAFLKSSFRLVPQPERAQHSLQDYSQFNLKLNVKSDWQAMQTRNCSITTVVSGLCLEQVSIAANMALTVCSTLYFGYFWTKKVTKKKVLPQALVPNTHFSFLDLGEIQHPAFRTAMHYKKDVIIIIYLSWFWTRESWYEAGASKGLKNYWQ